MYVQPQIAIAGKITDMIQGIAYLGGDLDGAYMPPIQFLDDNEEPKGPTD